MSKYIGDVSAYAYAVSKGYAGTEEEFAELMADYADVGQRAEDAADRAEAALDEFTSVTADATTLPEGSSATAEYSDGHLTLGIPKGDKGDTGAKGDGAVYAVIGNMASVIPVGTDGYLTSAYTITIPVTFYSGKDNVTGAVTSSDLYISRSSGGSGEMDTVPGSTYRYVKTATIIYAIPAGWRVGTGRITLTVTIGTVTLTYYHTYTIAQTGSQGEQGIQGPIGATPNLTIGTVTTLQPTAPATATITGTADNPVLSFGIPKGDTGEVSQEQFDAALALKADAIGNYPELAVGTAEQIDSDTVVSEDVAPYQFRQSISGASNRAYDKIVGGSLAVNQLVPDLGALTSSGSKAFNNGTAKIAGHKYLFSANISADGNTVGLYSKADDVGTTEIILNYSAQSAIISAKKTATSDGTNNNSNGNMWLYPYIPNGSISNIMFIDLTAMFGTTIADYVYSLEQATAGAGVAWLKARFPRIFNAGYVPYNAGTLEHVSGLSAHKMTGFNQWDEEWEVGGYASATGEPWNTDTRIRSKVENPIKVLPSTSYCFNCPQGTTVNVMFYDANDTFISTAFLDSKEIFITPSNCHIMRFAMQPNYGTTYHHDICINLHWDGERDGEYEPYKAHSYPLDDSLELRGIPKLDADNNLVYDGDVYESTGKVTRKYGIVDLGTLNYVYESSVANTHFLTGGTNMPKLPKYKCALMSDLYIWKPNGSYSNIGNMEMCVDNSESTPVLRIKNDSYDNVTAFKTAMSGVYLVYELATPTTESAQPFTNPQVVYASGTEEYVNDSVVPVGHVTKYVENLKAKLESAPASPAEDGDYIVRQTDGVNEYVPIDSAPAITAKADVSELLKAFPVDTASGAIASFTDGAELPLKSLAVDIDPLQDLHGYDNPWPAGGGKNLLSSIDATFTDSGVTWTLNSDGSVKLEGTATANSVYDFGRNALTLPAGTYITYDQTVSGVYSVTIFKVLNGTASTIKSGGGAFTLTEATSVFVRYVVTSGTTVNTTIYPQLEKGSTATAYAPYENICPISGHTQAAVTRTGVNVWDEEWEVGGISADNGENATATDRIRSKNYISVVPGMSYYFKASNTIGLRLYDGDKHYVTSTVQTNLAYTIPANIRYVRFIVLNTTTYNHDISINYPSTDHDYHPYSGQSINIQLGQTVYGGTLDVTNGVLTIDRAMVDMGTLAWASNGTDSVYTPMLTNKLIGGDNCVCSALAKVAQGTQVGSMSDATFKTYANSVDVAVRLSGITNQNAQTMLSGFQFVYPLATPITVQLTPHEVTALLGSNNVWADSGNTAVEYRADPTLYIQRKIAEALS